MTGWNQASFNTTLQAYLKAHKQEVWPKALNKKAAQVAWQALKNTRSVERVTIDEQLNRMVIAERKGGSPGQVPVGYVIAAKRATKKWTSSTQFQRAQQARLRGKSGSELKAWRRLVKKTFLGMVGARKRSTAFLRVGWISVLQQMRAKGVPYTGSKGQGVVLRGRLKGGVDIATPGKLTVVMENTANARSENRGGFKRIGEPALQLAMDFVKYDMEDYLSKAETDKFNRAQK
jgi:hypothetical protein